MAVPNSLGPGELLMCYGTQAQKENFLPRCVTPHVRGYNMDPNQLPVQFMYTLTGSGQGLGCGLGP